MKKALSGGILIAKVFFWINMFRRIDPVAMEAMMRKVRARPRFFFLALCGNGKNPTII